MHGLLIPRYVTDRMHGAARLGLLICAGCLFGLIDPRSAVAQVEGDCIATVNGTDVRTAASFANAIEVPSDGTIEVSGRSAQPTSSLRIELSFPLVHATVLDGGFTQPTAAWTGAVQVRDWARYGVGLYRVVTTTDACTASAWIDVTGRSPFTTVAGLSGIVLFLTGLASLITGLVRGGRRGRGQFLAILGGVSFGVGALVLAQQLGWIPVTWRWLALWTGGPGGMGGAANALLRRQTRQTALTFGDQELAATPTGGEQEPAAAPTGGEQEPAAAPTGGEQEPAAAPTGGEQEPAATPATDRRDPPRSAYALLQCPEVVVAGQRFELTVGLSPRPTPGVVGTSMRRPDSSVGPYTLSVQVVADGFRLDGSGQSWRRDIPVTFDRPYPTFELTLSPDPQEDPIRARFIQAMYSIGGQTMGMAVRSVAVAKNQDLIPEARVSPQAPGTDISIPMERVPPDLTVRIIRGQSESDGRLLWTFETPHHDIHLPDAPIPSDIGAHPESFAKQLIEQVGVHEGRPGLTQYLTGVGRTVADQVPDEFFTLLAGVAGKAAGRRPMILILSEEPYVPWELAVLEKPIDAHLLPFLAVQTDVGRWVLGHRRPKLPPPIDVDVQAAAVISGVYDRQEWRLAEAEDEAARIRETYGAASVKALSKDVLDCLQGNPRADLVHFAVHGVYNPEGAKEGLVMLDGETLDPLEVKGTTLSGQPFVFLNACQVGSGNQVLGDYAGMAEAFLYAGASGVVAPLWSVDDAVAREMALRFYERTLGEGDLPAEVLRAERARFGDDVETESSTYLAYQLFGHPAMRLTRHLRPTGTGPTT
jgi:hypothetical protein